MRAGALRAPPRHVSAASAAGRCERLPAGPLAVQLATPVFTRLNNGETSRFALGGKRFEPVFAKGREVDQEVDRAGHAAGKSLSSLEHGFARYGWLRTDRASLQDRLHESA